MSDYEPPDWMTLAVQRMVICAQLHDAIDLRLYKLANWCWIAACCTGVGLGTCVLWHQWESAIRWLWPTLGCAFLGVVVRAHSYQSEVQAHLYRLRAQRLFDVWLGREDSEVGLPAEVSHANRRMHADRVVQRALKDDGFRTAFERGE